MDPPDRAVDRARRLRANQTLAEERLWRRLRARKLDGFKFRRQFAVGAYIVDFCCIDAKLIVEADGVQHVDQVEYDARRTRFLESCGFAVIRFWNEEVMADIDGVWKGSEGPCMSVLLSPPHPAREGAPTSPPRGEVA